MASGYVTNFGAYTDVDLDDIFKLNTGGAGTPVGYIDVDGDDLATRYEAIGGGTKVADVGYEFEGSYISNLFADASQSICVDWPESDTTWYGTKNNTGTASAIGYFRDDGTYDVELADGTNIVNQNFLIAGSGVGAGIGYWVKWIKNSGDGPDTTNMNNSDQYYEITSGVDLYIGMLNSTPDTSRLGNYTITIAEDNSGTNLVTWTGAIRAFQTA